MGDEPTCTDGLVLLAHTLPCLGTEEIKITQSRDQKSSRGTGETNNPLPSGTG